jgi:hypothetical protein
MTGCGLSHSQCSFVRKWPRSSRATSLPSSHSLRLLAEHQRDHRQAEDDACQHQRPHRAEPQKQAAEQRAKAEGHDGGDVAALCQADLPVPIESAISSRFLVIISANTPPSARKQTASTSPQVELPDLPTTLVISRPGVADKRWQK